MWLRVSICIVSLLLTLAVCSFAQQFPLRKLTVEDGLGHSVVYRTTQTSDGYLWFSTDNGLTRYDGVDFRNFTTEDGLPSNFIFDVAEWKGKVYISTLGGSIVTMEDGTFKPAFSAAANAPAHPVEIRVNNNFFVVLDRFKSLHLLSDDGKFYEVTPRDLGLPDSTSLQVYNTEIDDNTAYVSTNYGFYTYSNNTFVRIRLKHPAPVYTYRALPIAKDRLLLVMYDHLVEYNLSTHQYTVLLEADRNNRFTRIKRDSHGNIWLSTMNGNVFFLRRHESGYRTLRIFNDIVVNDFFEDREKNLWLSTYGEGVWRIQSTHVRNHPIKGFIVSDMGIDPERKELLVTTVNAGLKVFGLDENHFLQEVPDNRFSNIFSNDIFLGPIVTAQENTYVGSGHTLVRINENTKQNLTLTNPITSIFIQKTKNRIWIGGRFELSYCNPSMDTFVQVTGFKKTVVRAIEEFEDGRVLVGTDNGLYIEDGDIFKPFPAEPALREANINTLYFDRRTNKLWAGTNVGLAGVEGGELKLINNPLTRIRCNAIAMDEAGNLFVGSVRGLIHYDGQRFEILSTKEGLTQANVVRVKYHQNEKVLTLLASNSISTIDTEYFPDILHFELPNIIIESITTEDETRSFTGKMVEFKTATKQLTVKLSTPQIRNRDKVAFRYRVNNEAWTSFNGSEIVLHSLPTGMMTINVQAHKINNEAESKTLRLSFYIPPPFYMKWWFITMGLLLTAMLFSLLVVYYSRKKNQKLLEENRRLDVEHKALRNLLNPHFLSNAINSIHAFILQNDQRQTLGYLSKFSQLVRLNLELLSSDQVSLDKEIKNISLYLEFEKLRFTDKLNYTIDIDPQVAQTETQIPSFIIQPFVENAIWHGLLPRKEGGDLGLQVKRQGDAVTVIIDDNGIGIKESLKHPKAEIDKKTSMGINIIYERFELLKKVNPRYHLDITDKSDLNGSARGTGTIVTITIPTVYTQNL